MIERPRGTHDVQPVEQPLWRHVMQTAEDLCSRHGYAPIQTPVLEDTELFQRTSGSGSDIVQKEMYTFTDRSSRSLTLRPELTAPICRAYIEHGMHRLPQPVKLYEIATAYRYAAPQRGRYREHYQLSVEAIGSDDPLIDAEIIQLYDELLHRLEIGEYHLELNSIGDRVCRPGYVERLNAWLDEHDDVLDDDARQKRATTPLRVFDVTDPRVREALADAPKIGESLCDACRAHFASVRVALDAYGVKYVLQPTLVRGLDYYTRTTWEFVGPEAGSQSTLSGGGRYDYLVEEIGGPPTPGVGFGAGIERLLLALGERELPRRAIDVFFVCEDPDDRLRVLPLVAELRRRGLRVDLDYAGRSQKGQITQAGRLQAGWTVIVEGSRATVREHGKDDWTAPLDALVDRIAG